MSDYVVSARKYRPDSFASLIGQDNIAQTLKNSITRGQLAHAYLFCGPRGVGKTSAARIFAKTINCSALSSDMDPCGECESCRSFREGRSFCIHELDAASNNGVEDIKALMDQVQIPPQVGRYSVYIIDEVHMLSQSAFNAFLKTLEEPPAHAIFILCTTEKHKIIPTILSRCQTYDFNRISVSDIVRNLSDIANKENVKIDQESLHVIARKADGAMRDALTIFDQTVAFCGTDIKYADVIRNLNVLDSEYGFNMVDAFLRKDYATALLTLDDILDKGFNAQHFICDLGEHLRNLLVARTGGMESLLDVPDSLRARYAQQAASCPVKFIYDGLAAIRDCDAAYRAATSQRLLIEFTLMKLCFINGVAEAADAASPMASEPQSASLTAPVRGMRLSSASPAPTSVASLPSSGAAADAARVASRGGEEAGQGLPQENRAALGTVRGGTVSEANGGVERSETFSGASPCPAEKDLGAASGIDCLAPAEPKESKEPAEPKSPPRKKASPVISFADLMNDDEIEVTPAQQQQEMPAPENDVLEQKWKEVASGVSDSRLVNALVNAKLEITEKEGIKQVVFYVMNEAQKKWIDTKHRSELESRYRQLVGSPKLNLEVAVTPAEAVEAKPYMPEDKVRDLMGKNENVKEFIADLGLNI